MTNQPRAERPTLILSLFDQKETIAKVRKANLGFDASGVLRYLARLELLPGPYSGAFDIARYLARDNAVASVAFENFNDDNLAGMAREFEGDALKASSRVGSPWIHGCASVKVSPEDFEGDYDDLVRLAHDLMKLFGVSKNRYFVAVHVDSNHIHVHFLYSRIGPAGELRERDRRHPKFMAEEACAYLANKYEFDLEDRHLSRVIDGEIVDLASRRVVRDTDFDDVPAGMIKRNVARMKVGKNDLYKLALVAGHVADGELDEFRWRLAKHGILYEPKGTGAEFIDVDETRIEASKLDYRFSRGRVLGGACAQHLPPTPPEIIQLAKSRRRLPHDSKAEIGRFMADRNIGATSQSADEDRWDRAVNVAMSVGRRGARPRSPDLPGWPQRMNVAGAIGARSRMPARVQFSEPYEVTEREWQTEVWNGIYLIATIRYSRMAILSKWDDDLRASLLAAKAAWGTVEVFGNPKFKKRIVALAAELNVPISNPELAHAMVVARAKHGQAQWQAPAAIVADGKIVAGSPVMSDRSRPPVAVNPTVIAQSADPMPKTQPGITHAVTSDQGSPAKPALLSTEIRHSAAVPLKPKLAPASDAILDKSEPQSDPNNKRTADLYSRIRGNDWRLIPVDRDGLEFTTVEPKTKLAFCIAEEDLSDPRMQAKLKQLYQAQQADKAAVLQMINDEAGRVSPDASPYGKGPVTMSLQTADRTLADLFARYQLHQDLHARLNDLYVRQQADRAKRNEHRHSAPQVNQQATVNEAMDRGVTPTDDGRVDLGARYDGAKGRDHTEPNIILRAEYHDHQPERLETPAKLEAAIDADIISPLAAALGTEVRDKNARHVDYEEELAELMKPRVFGMNEGCRVAEPEASGPNDPIAHVSANASSHGEEPKRLEPHNELDTAAAKVLLPPVLPPSDEHDELILRFETAPSDEERRKSAAAIRADKVALERMTERRNPQWIAINDQFLALQRMAAMKGAGIVR